MPTRRDFLKAGILAGAAVGPLGLPVWSRAQTGLAKFVDELPVPPVWSGKDLAERGLTMAQATHKFHRDLPAVPSWGYGGATYLGPTISTPVGQPVRFVARNSLGHHILGIDETLHGPDMADDESAPRVSLHFHGGYTSPSSDGYPEDTFTPGKKHIYDYANDQQPGSTWYHDHALGITRLNVYAGLAGFYLLRDPMIEAALPPAPFEIPIAIQDKSFAGVGGSTRMFYPDPWSPEFFGDTAVVNGKAWPKLTVRRGLYRFRLLNGSSSRFYNLRLSPRVPMYLIGTDSGFVPVPRLVNNIVLAPGERADVLVDFSGRSRGDRITLRNVALPPGTESPADIALPEIMQFVVQTGAAFGGKVPASIKAYPSPSPSGVVKQRNLLLVEVMDPATGEPAMALLNNRPWETDDIETPRVNTLEQWNLINLTADTHPIHLHLVQFRLRNRQRMDAEKYLFDVLGTDELTPDDVGKGTMPFKAADSYLSGSPSGPTPTEAGWKDTIQAHPGQVTRILVPFGSKAAPRVPFGFRVTHKGEYVWHCHILDHEDNEMMLPYRVIQ